MLVNKQSLNYYSDFRILRALKCARGISNINRITMDRNTGFFGLWKTVNVLTSSTASRKTVRRLVRGHVGPSFEEEVKGEGLECNASAGVFETHG